MTANGSEYPTGAGRPGTRRVRRRLLVALGLAAAFALSVMVAAGCGGSATGSPVYTEADDGSTVRAAVGDELTVRLSENASTGYTWTLRHSSGLKLLADELMQPTASPGVVGAPGTRVFKLEVTGAGRQVVRAVYHRPWEAGRGAVTQEFTLTVEVG